MKNMVKKQRGVTFIGWCIILAIIGFFVLITLRLFPLYNEMFEVITAMKSVGTRNGAETMGQREILTAFVRTAQTGGINRFNSQNVKHFVSIDKPDSAGGLKKLHVTYEAENVFFDDLYFIMYFDKTIELGGKGKVESIPHQAGN